MAPTANRSWENGNARQSMNSSSSSIPQTDRRMATPSLSLSVSTKGDVLPPIPTKVSPITPSGGRFDAQATVRNNVAGEPNHTPEGSGSDDYDEDYDDDLDPYPAMSPQHDNNKHLQEEVPVSDVTMLDSVILPAIASVRTSVFCLKNRLLLRMLLSYSPECRARKLE